VASLFAVTGVQRDSLMSWPLRVSKWRSFFYDAPFFPSSHPLCRTTSEGLNELSTIFADYERQDWTHPQCRIRG